MEKFRLFLNDIIPIFGGGIRVWTLTSIIIGLVSIIVMIYIARKGIKRKKSKQEKMNNPILECEAPTVVCLAENVIADTIVAPCEEKAPEIAEAEIIEVEIELNCSNAKPIAIEKSVKKSKRIN